MKQQCSKLVAAALLGCLGFGCGGGASGSNTGSAPFTNGPAPTSSPALPVLPALQNISPASGHPGDSVTLTGSRLGASQGTSSLSFNGMVGTPTLWSDTQIVCSVPTGALSGPVNVSIGGTTTNSVAFDILQRWEILKGGSSTDISACLRRTGDGGCIVAGTSDSPVSGDVTGTGRGDFDYWIVKVNAAGILQWQTLIGGSGADEAFSIQSTADGGYIVAGKSNSPADGDVTQGSHGGSDYWVVKLSGQGTIQWQRMLGGSGNEYARSVTQLNDLTYVVAGLSESSRSGDVTGTNHGAADIWIVRLSNDGQTILNQQLLGGVGDDQAREVTSTSDGGCAVAGGHNDTTAVATGDGWVVKFSSSLNLENQRIVGGSNPDAFQSIAQTSEGGYIVCGQSSSSASGDVTATSHGGYDCWVVKFGSDLSLSWNRLLGGSAIDTASCIRQTAEGGYVFVATTLSDNTGDVGPSNGNYDFWLVKLLSNGALDWQDCLGGSRTDGLVPDTFGMASYGNAWVEQASDGGYFVTGGSGSSQSGDVQSTNNGNYDYWIVKTQPNSTIRP